jgi:phosphoribosylformylglycinamidine cyclo-ligase
MPGMYADGDFDLAGFAVGILDKAKAIDNTSIKEGDIIVGLASSGFHSNGYSFLRKIFEGKLDKFAKTLLTPTRIYVPQVLAALAAGVAIKGMVHITGGGFYDNIPRVLPKGLGAVIDKSKFPKVPAIEALREFIAAQSLSIDEDELYRVFNMGVGYIFVIDKAELANLTEVMAKAGEQVYAVGTITAGEEIKVL